MGFPQLLAANRSLRNIRNGPSRYKMTQANLLPRFGAESDPVGRWAVPVAGVPLGRAAKARAGRRPQTAASTPPAPPPSFQPRVAQPGGRSWWHRLAQAFGGRTSAAGQGPVQAELMLGGVEPMRNQLGDNDLNLEQAAHAPAPASGVARGLVADVHRAAWRRWVGRIFGRLGHDRA